MERAVFLLKPEQRQQLNVLAKQENVSVAEIGRRAIDLYLETSKEDLDTLNSLMDALHQSNTKAQQALESAEKALMETLTSIRRNKK